jgi:hypothetical protein
MNAVYFLVSGIRSECQAADTYDNPCGLAVGGASTGATMVNGMVCTNLHRRENISSGIVQRISYVAVLNIHPKDLEKL